MTNHHVGSDNIAKLSTPERNLMSEGFLARTHAEELKCEDLELLALWTIEDVTERVNAAVKPEQSTADANAARRQAMAAIETEAGQASGLDCEVVTLWQGARYHLYGYRRYTDIRLVFCPEEAAAFFGGDADNFEFPRFNLDCAFFRIYEDGHPLKAEHHLIWSKAGAKESELAIVCGHPGSTQRLNTVDHLKFLRDMEEPANLANLWRREVQAGTFARRGEEQERIVRNELHGVENSRKAVTGIMAGLLDPELFKAKQAAEDKLRAAVEANPEYRAQWGEAWTQIADTHQKYRTYFHRYGALEGRRRAIRADYFAIAKTLVRLAEEKPKPTGERLREFRDSELDTLMLELLSPAPIYDDLEIARLANGLTTLAQTWGADDPVVVAALGGMSPQARAEQIIGGTKLKDVEVRKQLAEGGLAAIKASDDPLIRLAATLEPKTRRLLKKYQDEVESAEVDAYAKIAAAKFAIEGENSYPDATFTLRLSFGPIKGLQQDGATIPAFTTMGGTYERMKARGGIEPFKLPQRWIDGKDKLDLATPYNFVCTADIIGGNSGSPAVNTGGEVIGLIFDGNMQSLIWDIAYTETQGRAVCVDSRAIIECLRKLYDAGGLADELTKPIGQGLIGRQAPL